MTTTAPNGRTRAPARSPRARASTPPATDPKDAITGVAGGSLGTGTAVSDETTLMETPRLPEPAATAQTAGFLHAARRASRTLPERAAATDPPQPEPEPAAVPAHEPEPAVPESATARVPVPAQAPRLARTRRDPYRPIGIALAAILVALAGVAVLSNGADAPADAVGPPAPTSPPRTDEGGDRGGGDPGSDAGRGGPGNGNGNGRGNGNGNGRGNGNGGPH